MADEPVSRREFDREIDRLNGAAGRQDDRVTRLAADMVPLAAHSRDVTDLAKDIADVKADLREDMDRRFAAADKTCKERHGTAMGAVEDFKNTSRFSRQQIVAMVAIAATIAAAFIGVLWTSGGGHK